MPHNNKWDAKTNKFYDSMKMNQIMKWGWFKVRVKSEQIDFYFFSGSYKKIKSIKECGQQSLFTECEFKFKF